MFWPNGVNTFKMKSTQTETLQDFYAVGVDIYIDTDNKKLILGTGQNANIYYNGTDLIINPQAVGNGKAAILGNATAKRMRSNFSASDGSQGITKTCASTTTLTIVDGLITGCA